MGTSRNELPEDFDRLKLDALRALTVFVKGSMTRFSQFFDPSIVTADEIRRFLQGGKLDFAKTNRVKLGYIYNQVHRFIASPDFHFKTVMRPLVRQVYPEHNRLNQAYIPAWSLVEMEARKLNVDEIANLNRRLSGVYLTYRHGTGRAIGGEVVVSALHIFSNEDGGELALRFEIAYPMRSNDGDPEVMISGDVLASGGYLHFVGFDRGSRSPYLFTCVLDRRERIYQDLVGVALRGTTNGKIFSARVYGERSSLTWEAAILLSKIINVNDLSADIVADKLDNIKKHIDNNIHNREINCLVHYER